MSATTKSPTTKIVLGVAIGYVLGRTKKLRLAATVGRLLAGHRLAHPPAFVAHGLQRVEQNPQLHGLVTGSPLKSARDAAIGAAATRMESATRALQATPSAAGDDDAEQERPRRGAGRKATSRAGTATKKATKTARKATKKTAKKAATTKSAAKRAPAKKTAARTRSAAKSGSSSRSRRAAR